MVSKLTSEFWFLVNFTPDYWSKSMKKRSAFNSLNDYYLLCLKSLISPILPWCFDTRFVRPNLVNRTYSGISVERRPCDVTYTTCTKCFTFIWQMKSFLLYLLFYKNKWFNYCVTILWKTKKKKKNDFSNITLTLLFKFQVVLAIYNTM